MQSTDYHLSLTKQLSGLAGWIMITVVFATIGTLSSTTAGGFYLDLVRPKWAPLAWLFGPAWTTLYFFMAIPAFLRGAMSFGIYPFNPHIFILSQHLKYFTL